MKQIIAYRSNDGNIHVSKADALRVDKEISDFKKKKERSYHSFESLSIGDKIVMCFRDTGGGIVFTYDAVVKRDKKGDLWFDHQGTGGARHDLVKDVKRYGRMEGDRIYI